MSPRVASVADDRLSVLGPPCRSGGVLCRLSTRHQCQRRPSSSLCPLQGAPKRMHSQLSRSVQPPLSGKSPTIHNNSNNNNNNCRQWQVRCTDSRTHAACFIQCLNSGHFLSPRTNREAHAAFASLPVEFISVMAPSISTGLVTARVQDPISHRFRLPVLICRPVFRNQLTSLGLLHLQRLHLTGPNAHLQFGRHLPPL